MGSYTVTYTREAADQLAALTPEQRDALTAMEKTLVEDPRPAGSHPVAGSDTMRQIITPTAAVCLTYAIVEAGGHLFLMIVVLDLFTGS